MVFEMVFSFGFQFVTNRLGLYSSSSNFQFVCALGFAIVGLTFLNKTLEPGKLLSSPVNMKSQNLVCPKTYIYAYIHT